MRTLIAVALAFAFGSASVHAGGPVVVVEEAAPTVEEKSASSSGILPWLMVPLLLCVVMCGPEDEDTPAQ
jgi:hypothetical protein